jgi:hypothetical protein
MVGKTIRRVLDMMASGQQGLSRVEVDAALNECVHLLQLIGSPLADQRSLLDKLTRSQRLRAQWLIE